MVRTFESHVTKINAMKGRGVLVENFKKPGGCGARISKIET